MDIGTKTSPANSEFSLVAESGVKAFQIPNLPKCKDDKQNLQINMHPYQPSSFARKRKNQVTCIPFNFLSHRIKIPCLPFKDLPPSTDTNKWFNAHMICILCASSYTTSDSLYIFFDIILAITTPKISNGKFRLAKIFLMEKRENFSQKYLLS